MPVTKENATVVRPSGVVTAFPGLWPYFMADERGYGRLQPNEEVIATIGFNDLGIIDFELWGKSHDPVSETHLYYLVQGGGLLFLDEISTPVRESTWEELTTYGHHTEEEALYTQERERVVEYAIDLAVKLHNEEIDRDSLPWVVYGGWDRTPEKVWTRNDTVRDLELAARLMGQRFDHVRSSLQNLGEYDRLAELYAETLSLAQTLGSKSADPDYQERDKERCAEALATARQALDASPHDMSTRVHCALLTREYAVASGRGLEEASGAFDSVMRGE